MPEALRVDKWLWAVRLCKTRALAAEWCASGKVKRGGHCLKAGGLLRVGDMLDVPFVEGPGLRTFKVNGLPDKRVGAPEAQASYDDLTAGAVYEAWRGWQAARREAMRGRPTKKNRREIDKIHGFWDERG